MARPKTGPRLQANNLGYHEIRWNDNGRSHRVSKGTKEISEAQTFLAGWLQESGRDRKSRPSVKAVLETYLKEKSIKVKSSRQESAIRCSLIPLLGEIPVDALSRQTAYSSIGKLGKMPPVSM